MNLSEMTYPKDTKNRVQNLLVQESRRKPKTAPRWRKPAALTFAGLALAGTTAAGVYVAMAPVEDKRDIRCYYHADLTTRPRWKGRRGRQSPLHHHRDFHHWIRRQEQPQPGR
ncbi:hypothetical protein GU243_03340 [Pseudarthrobacter psychrotolerans]|uniref:Uncharacterized protein n=1 Tax=Pseudarthrobacter psychrotolerans TaxID=2697569 RepID=A0A6P1NQ96_9MICC|nr:hypothetical protein [Pseudarthrobacter psychrotolerans]QHK18951.1 hypothetical protein GU243_03340 [Pseudarthrobacter psychrotolerans]